MAWAPAVVKSRQAREVISGGGVWRLVPLIRTVGELDAFLEWG